MANEAWALFLSERGGRCLSVDGRWEPAATQQASAAELQLLRQRFPADHPLMLLLEQALPPPGCSEASIAAEWERRRGTAAAIMLAQAAADFSESGDEAGSDDEAGSVEGAGSDEELSEASKEEEGPPAASPHAGDKRMRAAAAARRKVSRAKTTHLRDATPAAQPPGAAQSGLTPPTVPAEAAPAEHSPLDNSEAAGEPAAAVLPQSQPPATEAAAAPAQAALAAAAGGQGDVPQWAMDVASILAPVMDTHDNDLPHALGLASRLQGTAGTLHALNRLMAHALDRAAGVPRSEVIRRFQDAARLVP